MFVEKEHSTQEKERFGKRLLLRVYIQFSRSE